MYLNVITYFTAVHCILLLCLAPVETTNVVEEYSVINAPSESVQCTGDSVHPYNHPSTYLHKCTDCRHVHVY